MADVRIKDLWRHLCQGNLAEVETLRTYGDTTPDGMSTLGRRLCLDFLATQGGGAGVQIGGRAGVDDVPDVDDRHALANRQPAVGPVRRGDEEHVGLGQDLLQR